MQLLPKLVAPELVLFVLKQLRGSAVGVLPARWLLRQLSATTALIPWGCDARLPHGRIPEELLTASFYEKSKHSTGAKGSNSLLSW